MKKYVITEYPGLIRKYIVEGKNKEDAYKAWEQWLEKCPVEFIKLRTPTVDLETVQFDFDQYEDTKENE